MEVKDNAPLQVEYPVAPSLDSLSDDDLLLVMHKLQGSTYLTYNQTPMQMLLPLVLTSKRLNEVRLLDQTLKLRTALSHVSASMQVLEWAHVRNRPPPSKSPTTSPSKCLPLTRCTRSRVLLARSQGAHCPWPHTIKSEMLVQFAARHGAIDVMEYARSHGCPWERPRPPWHNGEDDGDDLRNERISPLSTMREAAGGGFTAFVEAAHALGCPWGAFPMGLAAMNGHLKTIMTMHSLGCPINANVAYHAASAGRIEMLYWLRDVHAPMSLACAGAACCNKIIEPPLGVLSRPAAVVQADSTEVMTMPIAKALPYAFAQDNNEEADLDLDGDDRVMLKMMKGALELGGKWTTGVLQELVDRGSFETMRWVLEQGCAFPADATKVRDLPT